MPRRARFGRPSGVSARFSVNLRPTWSLAAAAAPAAAAATPAARYAGVHHRVRRERGGPRGYGGEVGDHTPRFLGAALGTRRDVVGGAHRAHEVEALLALGAPVLVEGHLSPPLVSATVQRPSLYRGSRLRE